MFTENSPVSFKDKGWIEVITGSMFSGKTEELIRRLNRAMIANLKVITFKPAMDDRYARQKVVSHDQRFMETYPVSASSEILSLKDDADVIGIDEAQFFDDGLPDVCNALANQNLRVIVAGLDLDFIGKPFGPLPRLLAMAEYITKVHAICIRCGDLAYLSRRKTKDEELVRVGKKETYEPLCRKCFNIVHETKS